LIILVSDDGSVEGSVTEAIEDAILSHTDGRCRDYMVGEVKLCEMLQETYHPIETGYDYKDLAPFTRQMDRLKVAFRLANELQVDASLYWEDVGQAAEDVGQATEAGSSV
jgi:hypothetical protein